MNKLISLIFLALKKALTLKLKDQSKMLSGEIIKIK